MFISKYINLYQGFLTRAEGLIEEGMSCNRSIEARISDFVDQSHTSSGTFSLPLLFFFFFCVCVRVCMLSLIAFFSLSSSSSRSASQPPRVTDSNNIGSQMPGKGKARDEPAFAGAGWDEQALFNELRDNHPEEVCIYL